jgi:hypothetical protein
MPPGDGCSIAPIAPLPVPIMLVIISAPSIPPLPAASTAFSATSNALACCHE